MQYAFFTVNNYALFLHNIHVNKNFYIETVNDVSLNIDKDLSCNVIVINIDTEIDVLTNNKDIIDVINSN